MQFIILVYHADHARPQESYGPFANWDLACKFARNELVMVSKMYWDIMEMKKS
jgi:hypothetical protein